MVDTLVLRTAVEAAWSNFCATQDGVDASRRCLLKRHLGRCEDCEKDGEELASFGLAYLAGFLKTNAEGVGEIGGADRRP